MQVQGKEKKRYPPLPLSTLEMQKKATQSLHMPGERIMKYAEELYQAGFISYPRTETDGFPPSQDIMVSPAATLTDLKLLRVSHNRLSDVSSTADLTVVPVYLEWPPHSSSAPLHLKACESTLPGRTFTCARKGPCEGLSPAQQRQVAEVLHPCIIQSSFAECGEGLQAMVREHEGDARWGAHAQAIVHGNMWKPPGNGGHDDKVSCMVFDTFASRL